MKRLFSLSVLILLTACAPGQIFGPSPSPSPTMTPSPTSTATITPSPTSTPTITPTPSPTPLPLSDAVYVPNNWIFKTQGTTSGAEGSVIKGGYSQIYWISLEDPSRAMVKGILRVMVVTYPNMETARDTYNAWIEAAPGNHQNTTTQNGEDEPIALISNIMLPGGGVPGGLVLTYVLHRCRAAIKFELIQWQGDGVLYSKETIPPTTMANLVDRTGREIRQIVCQ